MTRGLSKGRGRAFVIGLFFLVVCALPFVHSKYKKLNEWGPYSRHYANHNKIIKGSDSLRFVLIEELKLKGLSGFAERFENLEKKKKKDLKFFFDERKRLKEEYSFLGYSSFRYFLYAIGLPLFSLLVSVFCFGLIIFRTELEKREKVFYLIPVIGFLFVSFFWVIRAFSIVNFQDYHDPVLVLLTFLAVFIVVGLVYFFKELKSRNEKWRSEVEDFMDNSFGLIEKIKEKTNVKN